ncbi:sensor histidine kinase [Butyrivibrio sp. AD3002]|uniref:sensor histidine kinase n=1 Tax=Butyrivibrio sp. AD3002 TaxID=1280670 RepID=UPI0003B5165D|nr:histidine kinase [Butyrivibrio sp. AD3002]
MYNMEEICHYFHNILPASKKKHSLLHRFDILFLMSMLIFTTLLAAVTMVIFFNLREFSYRSVQDSLRFYDNRLDVELSQNIMFLIDNCSSDPDIIRLRTTMDSNEEVGCMARIQNRLSTQITPHSVIRGFYLYYPDKDVFLPVYNTANTGTSSGYPFPSFIRSLLQAHLKDDGSGAYLPQNWYFIEDQNCLIRTFRVGGIYGGAWIDLNNLPGFEEFFGNDAILLITDSSGQVLFSGNTFAADGNANDSGKEPNLPVEKSLSGPVTVSIPGIGKRIIISFRQSFSDYCFTVLLPQKQFLQAFRSLYYLLALIILWAVCFFISYNRMGRMIIEIPTKSLMAVTRNIRSGNLDTRITPSNNYEETVQITDAFNKLISEIGNLRISVYEEQLQAREFELKSLKNQVAPHFLINCLNTVFMSAQDQSNLEVTNQIISTLSSHLRYTLSDRNIVPLSEELEYLENYILLTQYRFPETLHYEKEIDPDLLNTEVFPMILLTLTENSIKTGLIMGEPFLIRVKATKKIENDETFVYLEHTDSGSGLSEEKLEKYNHILEHPEVTEKGTGIGLYNTAMRLRLILGSEAMLSFANAEGMGLCVTIRFPYKKYSEKESFHESSDNR